MDWKTFAATIVQAGAWPVSAFAMVYLLRNRIGDLISNLHRLKWKGLEAEFGKEIDELSKKAGAVLPAKETPPQAALEEPKKTEIRRDSIVELAEVSPPAAILMAWTRVEDAVNRAWKRGSRVYWEASTGLRVQALEKRAGLPKHVAELIESLRRLRNITAHAPPGAVEVTREEALEYHDVARFVIDALDRL